MSDGQSQKTNWSICVICQIKTKEPLQCPAESKRTSNVGAGYKTLANNIIKFNELGFMPVEIDIDRLDEGDGIHNTFLNRNARWHKSCYSSLNSTKLQRAEKRHSQDNDTRIEPKYTRSNATATTVDKESVCFFCNGLGSKSNPLHMVSSLGVDTRVREYASSLQDKTVLAKLSGGDLIALDASYHTSCLVSYYKKGKKSQEEDEHDSDLADLRPVDSIVLAELVSYIEESRCATELSERIFKLATLANMYTERMKQLGEETFSRVNTSRLKGRILSQVPSLEAYNEGRDVYLAFKEDVGDMLQKTHESCDDEAIHLAQAANVVRKDMFSMKCYSFDGSFKQDCQIDSVPKSLLTLIQMILYGPNIENQRKNSSNLQASLTISQIIQYNSYIRRRDKAVSKERRNKARETPVPLYLGLAIHAKTRSRDLIETMHDLGLCVSYDRVLSVSTDLGNTVIRRYHEDGVVCPPNLRLGLFTTSAIDNIDHNPSSTTAHDSFHGTGISMFQHMSSESPGTVRGDLITNETAANTKAVVDLPEWYTNVKPATLPSNAALPEKSVRELQHISTNLDVLKEEGSWLVNTNNAIFTSENTENVSWSAYYANKERDLPSGTSTISALLPLFPDDSKSVAMIRHAMEVVKNGVSYLNGDQVPVIAMDQPLYAIGKQIQWTWKDSYGESKFVLMFGGLHIEMGFMKAIGDWLEESGWTTALVDAKVASSGTSDSFLKASNVTRSRKAHQITACSLYTLLLRAYSKYQESLSPDDDSLEFSDWCDQQISASPQFYFWYTAMQLELLLLVFIRSIRQANFELYMDSISKMLPWFFGLNHSNYARWLSVHLQDMRSLQTTAPDVAEQFTNGNFIVHKSSRKFSAIAIDQAHEQNNAIVKGDGGAVGLTENAGALRRWMVSGPELARLVNEFERGMTEDENNLPTKHHEEYKSYQDSIAKDVKELVSVFEDLDNPFMEDSGDLIVLDTKEIADSDAVARLRAIEPTGVEQCNTFIDECLVKGIRSIYDPIKRNKRSFFSSPAPKKSKAQQQVASLKSDCSLFARLYISCQTRDGDLDEFFMHENQACPPSLSSCGKLRLPNKKSELADCLQAISPYSVHSQTPTGIQAVIVDGAVVVNMVKPSTETTFSGYATNSFLPYIKAQLRIAHRVDIVFDEYIDNSLKATTRSNRGSGVRMRVGSNIKLPRKWSVFLREAYNKRELFKFLAECSVSQEEIGRQIIATYGQQVLCTPSYDTSNLSPCTHEEADSRMMLHAADAVRQGYQKILIRTVDTDVLVLAVSTFNQLPFQQQVEFWLAFGIGKHLRFIAVHELTRCLGPERSKALPAFHAFTGCDTVSSFAGRSKKTAMEAWKAYPDVTSAFQMLAIPQCQITEECMMVLERYVVLLYDRTSDKAQVNDARKQLFSQKGRTLDSIPPTRAALMEHTKRAAYQAGQCWGQALLPQPQLPSPQQWGWNETSDGWQPYWTSLPEVTKSCRELVRCGCKKSCSGRCSCKKADLSCTALCTCTCEM